MIEFRPITINDKDWIQNKIKEGNYQGCEFSFGNNFIWRNIYQIQAALIKDCLIFKSNSKNISFYSYPIGKNGEMEAVEQLLKENKSNPFPTQFRGILEEHKKKMEKNFPGLFEYTTDRGDSDYIYSAEKLATLSGKKLHGKRNHIRRFKDCPDWHYEPIREDNISKCYQMNELWCELNQCALHKSLRKEMCAVKEALDYFFDLSLEGGMLIRKNKVIAYSIGEPLNSDTYVVHIEKAFSDIQGAYPMMNQQFVIHNCQNYMYVNREEDTGEEGLRKAKLSYYPEIILDKYSAHFLK